MAGTIDFKCPACGGHLEYDPARERLVCGYCGSEFSREELERMSAQREKEAAQKDGNTELKSYHCSNCGAEIVTEETTAATRCYFCHSPVVLTDRVSNEYRPDILVPFKIDRENARSTFDKYLKKKKFVDRKFFSAAQLEDFSGVYYPYWITDLSGEVSFDGEGRTVSTMTARNVVITTTRFYRLEREGTASFSNMIRKALKKADRKLSDGIHPYDLQEATDFSGGYLSGFLAEKRDVEKEEAEQDVLEEAKDHAKKMITENSGLSGLSGKTSFRPDSVRSRYALLPAWVLTYSHDVRKKVYYYMMNGQTGRICGKLPLRYGKLLAVSILVGALVFGAVCAGGAYLW